MESLHDILARHPDFAPSRGRLDDAPSIEEIWAANTITPQEAEEISDQLRAERIEREQRRRLSKRELLETDIGERTIRAGIPERYRDVPFNLTYLEPVERGRGLYVHGIQGDGKTWIACSVLRAWISRHRGLPLFVTSVGLLAEIAATYDSRESELGVLAKYASCPVLVIDDLGKENPTAHALSKLWQLIDMRYGAMLPTVVTTQYDANQLALAMSMNGGDETARAIVSRLRETCDPVDAGKYDRRLGGAHG